MNPNEAAKFAGVSRNAITTAVAAGHLKARTIRTVVEVIDIDAKDLTEWMLKRRPRGPRSQSEPPS